MQWAMQEKLERERDGWNDINLVPMHKIYKSKKWK